MSVSELPASERGRRIQADLLLLLTTVVWGWTFVGVKEALASVRPFTFLAVRFTLAFIFLAVLYPGPIFGAGTRAWKAGGLIGLLLFAGYAFQTVGLQYTTASKAGFLTGLAVVIVPVLSAAIYRRLPGSRTSIGILLAAAGLGLLTLGGSLIPSLGDILVFLCAVSFALQILAVERFTRLYNPAALAAIQILGVAVLSALFAIATEPRPKPFTAEVWWAVVITGVLATSMAFLIQNAMQRFTSATQAALIFSAEPVFAALFAFFLLGEVLGGRGLAGAAMILGGMILAETGNHGQGR